MPGCIAAYKEWRHLTTPREQYFQNTSRVPTSKHTIPVYQGVDVLKVDEWEDMDVDVVEWNSTALTTGVEKGGLLVG